MTLPPLAWHYGTTAAFNDSYYKNLLMPNSIVGSRTSIRLWEGGEPVIVYILQKDRVKYALDEAHVIKLPLLVMESEKIVNGKDVYDHILKYKSAKFKPDKCHTFRQLIDEFIPFSHENQHHFTLWKIIAMASYLTRINIRVATNPGFGKDSAIKALSDLFGDVTFIANPTIAKLEYCLNNKTIMLNEVNDLNADERRHIEQFFLSCGDFSNKYTKRSRATDGALEQYNISKLSILVTYNTVEDYGDDTKYFDKVFQNAVRERFLPLLLSGKITEHFEHMKHAPMVAEQFKDDFVRFIRSVEFYKHHWREQFVMPSITAGDLGFKGRFAITVQNLLLFINAYSKDRDEFMMYCNLLRDAYLNYQRMLNTGNDTLETFTAFEEVVR